ncbi:hypothetical protein BKA70DRAFT_1370893 [Coprinopsis sp. MPI-PUGE-AT-0042]|nr:hypothetical protein BKA70DRAFT_1370893 [Coprinopsis sp. MPI-PUGE-AT-0042]
MAYMYARFITHLFACPEYPLLTTTLVQARLPHFVAYTLHRTKLHPSAIFTSLIFLHRLKARFSTARGSSGHCQLSISAFMIASKVISNNADSLNKSWGAQEINLMEHEMCVHLYWGLTMDPGPMLSSLDIAVCRVRGFVWKDNSKKTYPSYPLTAISK